MRIVTINSKPSTGLGAHRRRGQMRDPGVRAARADNAEGPIPADMRAAKGQVVASALHGRQPLLRALRYGTAPLHASASPSLGFRV